MLEIEKPRIECVERDADAHYAKFVVEPLERGYGITLGNSLRRVLLSSLPGAAISSIKIDGILHEFSTLPGVLEDITEVILNLKQVVLKYEGEQPKVLRLEQKGKKEVRAGDIERDAEVEIINPDLLIATLNEDGELNMELTIERGRGYVSADQKKKSDEIIGVIPIDSIFTPIRKVNFTVENARVGRITDYDRLMLEVWTNGTITPEEGISLASKILINYLKLFSEMDDSHPEIEMLVEKEEEKKDKIPDMPIEELELSVRASNGLKRANINTVGDLVQRTREEMAKIRNLGQKSLDEIESKLKELGLSFKQPED
ncbi:MAG: DNA-directed RNA polymerase subunit alpha [Syntrophomonadaceae bacterium]|nr:DNA-directed RNA polymerase subunit alpha [Syntrophomonadaceae bacterium]